MMHLPSRYDVDALTELPSYVPTRETRAKLRRHKDAPTRTRRRRFDA